MKKISTLFKKDPTDLGRVINEINPENQWVFDGEGVATRKFDGTACMILDGQLYKRYDLKRNKKTGEFPVVPDGAIACQEPDSITGHWPHWIKCSIDNAADKYHMEGFKNLTDSLFEDGTYELVGPKVQGNPEGYSEHELVKHGTERYYFNDYSFEFIKKLLDELPIEGIVFHHKTDGHMCKIRKSDFGLKR